MSCQILTQLCRAQLLSRLRHHICHQPLLPIFSARHHHALSDGCVTCQHRLDLSQLDPIPSHLHLLICSSYILYPSITNVSPHVSTAVVPLSFHLYILLFLLLCSPHIPPAYSSPSDVQLSDHSHRHHVPPPVHQPHSHPSHRSPDDLPLPSLRASLHLFADADDGRFRR